MSIYSYFVLIIAVTIFVVTNIMDYQSRKKIGNKGHDIVHE